MLVKNIIDFLGECRRVLDRLTIPTKKEFEKIAKITGLGILLIGFVGFIMGIIFNLF